MSSLADVREFTRPDIQVLTRGRIEVNTALTHVLTRATVSLGGDPRTYMELPPGLDMQVHSVHGSPEAPRSGSICPQNEGCKLSCPDTFGFDKSGRSHCARDTAFISYDSMRSVVTPGLCNACSRLDIHTVPRPVNELQSLFPYKHLRGEDSAWLRTAQHYENLGALAAAASAGCALCSFILERGNELHTGFQDRPSGRVSYVLSPDARPDAKPNILRFTGDFHDDLTSWSVEVHVYVHAGSPLAEIITGRSTAERIDATSCAALAKPWYDTCVKGHLECKASSGSYDLPTRVIDISGQRPRLLVTKSRRGQWVSLSHCWGTAPPFNAVKDNLDSLQDRLPLELIPATFKDAIEVTRNMGFRYLWIDSLCILQDSTEDWAAESTKMQHYYKHAALTIVAESASGDREGFLNKRRLMAAPVVATVAHDMCSGKSSPVYIQDAAMIPFLHSNQERGCLSERAWTLQEDLLSPRKLRFLTTRILWECRHCTVTEDNAYPVKNDVTVDPFFVPEVSLKKRFKRLLPTRGKSTYFEDVSDFHGWYRILDDYLARKLTMEKDRLIAVDGVATDIALRTQRRYVLGLWKEDIHRGLLWRLDMAGTRADVERAPSWSWAALDRVPVWHNFQRLKARTLLEEHFYHQSTYDDHRATIEVDVPAYSASHFDPDLGHVLVVKGLCMRLCEWSSPIHFRDYRDAQSCRISLLSSADLAANDTLVCSFDEQRTHSPLGTGGPPPYDGHGAGVNPSSTAVLSARALGASQCKRDRQNALATSADCAASKSTSYSGIPTDILLVQIMCCNTDPRGRLVAAALLLESCTSRPGHFRRIGLAEVPATAGLHVRGWSWRDFRVL